MCINECNTAQHCKILSQTLENILSFTLVNSEAGKAANIVREYEVDIQSPVD